ncbi:MAG TPA: YihY/virulence factor BrkB family protein [Thermoanaerobaculia bacterium]|nr:YihY/virulence factor BrkB family protein [Thermoanaerobaculia bacterium]
MRSIWSLGGLSWWRLAVRVYRQAMRDELLGRAAELAYFFLFSVFPLLLFLTTLLGYMARGSWGLRRQLFQWVATVSPSVEVTSLLQNTLVEVTRARGGAKLSFGLLAAIWVASNGMTAVSRTLNTACGLRETRPWWMRRLVSVGLVTVFAVLTVLALVVIFFGGSIAERLAEVLGLGAGFAWMWQVTQWSFALAFVILAFDLVYNVAPNLARQHYTWFTPGAAVGVALWVLASFGFQVYVSQFTYYSNAYGSLGAVILLLAWFYMTAAALLVGGEINSEIAVAIQGGAAREERSRQRRQSQERRREGDVEDADAADEMAAVRGEPED